MLQVEHAQAPSSIVCQQLRRLTPLTVRHQAGGPAQALKPRMSPHVAAACTLPTADGLMSVVGLQMLYKTQRYSEVASKVHDQRHAC